MHPQWLQPPPAQQPLAASMPHSQPQASGVVVVGIGAVPLLTHPPLFPAGDSAAAPSMKAHTLQLPLLQLHHARSVFPSLVRSGSSLSLASTLSPDDSSSATPMSSSASPESLRLAERLPSPIEEGGSARSTSMRRSVSPAVAETPLCLSDSCANLALLSEICLLQRRNSETDLRQLGLLHAEKPARTPIRISVSTPTSRAPSATRTPRARSRSQSKGGRAKLGPTAREPHSRSSYLSEVAFIRYFLHARSLNEAVAAVHADWPSYKQVSVYARARRLGLKFSEGQLQLSDKAQQFLAAGEGAPSSVLRSVWSANSQQKRAAAAEIDTGDEADSDSSGDELECRETLSDEGESQGRSGGESDTESADALMKSQTPNAFVHTDAAAVDSALQK